LAALKISFNFYNNQTPAAALMVKADERCSHTPKPLQKQKPDAFVQNKTTQTPTHFIFNHIGAQILSQKNNTPNK
jgi:hypothetical protein